MPIKDIEKRRESNKLRQQRYRERHRKEGVMSQPALPPMGVTVKPIGDDKYRMVWIQGRWIRLII